MMPMRFSGPTSDDFSWVTARLLFWQAFDSSCKTDVSCSAHLLNEGLVFIDPIGLTPAAEKELFGLGDPFAVILTTGNHARAADEYRKRYNIPILADLEVSGELEVDIRIKDGELLFGQLRIIALPGAAPGEIAVYHPDHEILSLGDVLIHLPVHGFSVLPDKYCQNPKLARHSLKKLKETTPKILTFGHGLPIVSKAETRLNHLIDTNP
jgi:glyoxylase-like metal-dependent hydrolase (beta-lactamase superfamily II)